MSDYWQVGEIIRLLRKSNHLSQAELAKDICTQAEISRIERNLTMPNADTLFRISERLGVDMNFFFENSDLSRMEYIQETIDLIRKFIEEKNYAEVARIVAAEKKNPLFKKAPYRQFLMWHEGLVQYYVDGDFRQAIETLHEALDIYQPGVLYSETQLQILISVGNLFGEIKEYEMAFTYYYLCHEGYQRLARVEDRKIQIRLLYNMALTLSRSHKDSAAIPLCQEGIALCQETKSLYLFGELYYQLAYSQWQLHNTKAAVSLMEKAIFIFKLVDNEKYKHFAEQKLTEISEQT
ncbi:Transcriptional regulator, contains XRE-family HTH domain [Evansella caseinilytica]|uniref:Transcriptional regulator, contains XRE-family HTH domain n=1 Tax=Evansella caseinilytica TaxID=1503961 RepID=A0A1H3QZB7_9BACI|nr:helix-turn-helix domain-containing protein [Evansella caseinilytica]SDZ18700.1 Transcriptional regulator, contains XRE-family HTH domain [Evansella caseinilytica]